MRSVVLFSGGLDSTAALVMAHEASDVVAVVHVQYGQPHGVAELAAARLIAPEVEVFYISTLPTSGDIFVGRNPVILSLAASIAISRDATQVWAGFCQEDAAGFPDCREDFVKAQEAALRLALDSAPLTIITPLLKQSKADTIRFLMSKGIDIKITHTCYRGVSPGCGICSACITRNRAVTEVGQ